MKILLLGADGQVGWELRRSLLPLGNPETNAQTESEALTTRPHHTAIPGFGKCNFARKAAAWDDEFLVSVISR